ncbi:MAG: zf-HC2 domain-containing protein [Planctomycetes bacterium]|nr:zf-HC2 domain-containing protein [Planctomycetota bacterium]
MDTERQTLSCEEARAKIPQHVQGGLEGEEARSLRAHFEGCVDCAESYREQVEAKVDLGLHAMQEVEAAETRRKVERVRTSREMSAPERVLKIRTLILPLFFAWLLVQISGVFAQAPRIVLLEAEGAVDVAGRPVEAYEELGEDDALLLVRGAWCQVADGGRAVFEVPGGRFSLTGPAAVLAEGVEPPRLRVQYGTLALQVDGPLELVTQRGSLEVTEGSGTIVAGPEVLEVSWARGDGRIIDARGETSLEPDTVTRR